MSRRDQQLFPEPSSRVVWAAICALDEASQHDLLRELGKRLAFPADRAPVNTRALREARAIAALREAADELGKSPSVNEYRHLRKTAFPQWPPDGSIRDWLCGGWNEVLKRAHLEALPDDAPITVEGQHSFTREEVIQGLRECAEELGRTPTFHNYLNWARSPKVKNRPGRRTTSQNVFVRIFGGFIAAKAAAGLADEGPPGAPSSRLQRTGKQYRWSDGDFMNALTEAAEVLGEDRLPSSCEYIRIRQELIEASTEAAEKGCARVMPALNGFQRRFGSWRKAKNFYYEWREAEEQSEEDQRSELDQKSFDPSEAKARSSE